MNKAKFSNLFLRVSLQEKIIFTRHLSLMINAGVSLVDSLSLLKDQTKSRSLKTIFTQAIEDVNSGQFLSTSLEKYENVFGSLFINIIRVGEASGILADNLNYLSQELKKKRELRKKVVGAMIYPIVILVATFGITALLTVFIFPKIIPIFSSLDIELPITTKFFIGASTLLIEKGLLILGVLLAAIIGFILLLRIKNVRYCYQALLLRIPIAGKIIKSVNVSSFARTLGILLKSGVKIVEAVDITASTLSNLVYQKALEEISSSVQKGEFISKYLATKKGLFPVMLTNMIEVGENTGNLSETLLYLSDFYESEVDELTKGLANTLEPVLMITMGLVVGFVALSIITPIYEVTQTFGG